MEYTTRIVRSSEGLTKEAALMGLQEHPMFKPGTKIANIYNQGGCWVAKLMEPKVAGEDIFEEDIDESPADLHDELHDEHEESESPLEELEEHEDHEDSEDKKLKDLEKKLDLLLDALGISEKGEEPEIPSGPEDEGPTDLPAAPEKRGPKHEPLPPGSGAKLKPGEVPNKPGMTPVGAPAFASVKTAGCEGSCEKGTCEDCDKQHKEAQTSMPPNVAPAAGSPSTPTSTATGPAQNTCQKCGGPAGSCQCAAHDQTGGASGPVTAFTASKFDSGRTLTIRQAKAQLENHYEGFRVARIKRDGDAIHARLEKRQQ